MLSNAPKTRRALMICVPLFTIMLVAVILFVATRPPAWKIEREIAWQKELKRVADSKIVHDPETEETNIKLMDIWKHKDGYDYVVKVTTPDKKDHYVFKTYTFHGATAAVELKD